MKTYPHYSYRDCHTLTYKAAGTTIAVLIVASLAWAFGYHTGKADAGTDAYIAAKAAAERDYARILDGVNRVSAIREASAYRRGLEGR